MAKTREQIDGELEAAGLIPPKAERERRHAEGMAKVGQHIMRRTVTRVRPMQRQELNALGWYDDQRSAVVIELDNGALLFASSDPEGNAPGCMFVQLPDGSDGALFANGRAVELL